MQHRALARLLLLAALAIPACAPFGEAKETAPAPDGEPPGSTSSSAATTNKPAATSQAVDASAPATTQPFTSILIDGLRANVDITDGKAFDIQIGGIGSVDEGYDGSKLVLSGTQPPDTAPLTITITMPLFAGVIVNGATKVSVHKTTPATDVHLEVPSGGSGSVHFDGAAKILQANMGGLGDIFLAGSAQLTQVICSGSGTVEADGYSGGQTQRTQTPACQVTF